MALLKKDGSYVVVEKVDEKGTIIVREHADASHRERYKKSEETRFEHTIQKDYNIEISEDDLKVQDSTASIVNNLKIAGYLSLKKLEDFSGAQDV